LRGYSVFWVLRCGSDQCLNHFAGRRPAVAGLLGVLGASMSGSGLHPRLRASHVPSQALSDVYTFGAKRPLPRHLRIR
jgi:hypothetical protein